MKIANSIDKGKINRLKFQIKRNRFLWLWIAFLSLSINMGCNIHPQKLNRSNLLNFQHLEHLYESVQIKNQIVGVIHIYSEAPDYRWVEAQGEGISCVDDVARAAVLYLREYEMTGKKKYFQKARSFLRFVMAMQAPNGLFYNFIFPDYQINTIHQNSTNRLDFWTARAVWALGEGYLILKKKHPDLADSLRESLKKVLPAVGNLIQNYPKTEIVFGKAYPTWLINRYAADATSELLLGLVAYEKASANSVVKKWIKKLSEGLWVMQSGNWQQIPYGAHLSYPGIWHGWGNAQTQVLSRIGKELNLPQAISSAKKEADWFFSRLLIEGWMSNISLHNGVRIREFPQIAYEIRTVALGLENLWAATGDKKYATLAGLAGSWLLGDNAAGAVMYDTKTGRCFDGIEERKKINKNSGAESTIEALLTLQALQNNPISRPFLFFSKRGKLKTIRTKGGDMIEYCRYANQHGKEIFVYLNLSSGTMAIMNKNGWNDFLNKIGM